LLSINQELYKNIILNIQIKLNILIFYKFLDIQFFMFNLEQTYNYLSFTFKNLIFFSKGKRNRSTYLKKI